MLTKKFFKTKDEAEVTFEFFKDGSDSVSLVGEFNGWKPLTMRYVKKDKVFRTRVRLPKNAEFHFRYLINQQEWDNDFAADAYYPNQFGSDNSIVNTFHV